MDVRSAAGGAPEDDALAQADTMRESAPDLAYRCYRALRHALDDEQIAWLLAHMRVADPVLEPLVQRAARAPHGTDLWFHGQVRLAHFERAAGRIDAAIVRMAGLAGGVDGARRGLVYAKLGLLLLQGGRTIEGLLVCRRAVAALAGSPDRYDLARSRLVLANVYVGFRDWERYDATRAELDASILGLPDHERVLVERERPILELCVTSEYGEYDRTLAIVEELIETAPHRRAGLVAHRAYLLARLGRVDEAPPLDEPPPGLELRFKTVDAVCEIARGESTHLPAFFDDVARAGAAPGERLELLRQVIEMLDERPELAKYTKRACDLAAAAMLERIDEVERFARDPAPWIELTGDDRRELSRLRDAFLEHHDQLKRAVVRAFRSSESLQRNWYRGDGLLYLCAWCRQAQHRDGTWVPLGSLLPGDHGLRVTHGMCPDCRSAELLSAP